MAHNWIITLSLINTSSESSKISELILPLTVGSGPLDTCPLTLGVPTWLIWKKKLGQILEEKNKNI